MQQNQTKIIPPNNSKKDLSWSPTTQFGNPACLSALTLEEIIEEGNKCISKAKKITCFFRLHPGFNGNTDIDLKPFQLCSLFTETPTSTTKFGIQHPYYSSVQV